MPATLKMPARTKATALQMPIQLLEGSVAAFNVIAELESTGFQDLKTLSRAFRIKPYIGGRHSTLRRKLRHLLLPLMKQFEDLGESQDMQSIVDIMMHQLLSKEILYEPMKEIGERYPKWLEENKAKLSKEDYRRYFQQHKLIGELCGVYEIEPDNFQKIVELMQKMQDCGQPPSDIVQELALGLDLESEGGQVLSDLLADNSTSNCSIM